MMNIKTKWKELAWMLGLFLLLFGGLVAGFLLGRPGHEGLIPGKYVEMLAGDRPDPFLATISGIIFGAIWS
ncbi:MAG: hypothetical protein PWP23_2727 [Candidatus Sumerlaeota bacterium]|nr:hypothetical protein [Candidatus Sumerlaeota bacterium]